MVNSRHSIGQISLSFQVAQCQYRFLVQELQVPKVVLEEVDNSSHSVEDNNQLGREENS